jgi:hypothetical protein
MGSAATPPPPSFQRVIDASGALRAALQQPALVDDAHARLAKAP